MRQIPNIFTLLNLACGCIAIVFTLQNGITIQYNGEVGQFVDLSEKIWLASLFIGLAAVVDFADGFVARLFHATSEMGKQLDSLADVVSFGAAPAMIVYQLLRMSYASSAGGMDTSFICFVPAFALAAAAAYRLAKFNLDNTQQYGFRGVPVPAAGLLIASLPLIYWNADSPALVSLLLNKWLLYGLVILLSWLMVSRLPMMALKFKDLSLKNNLPKYLLILIAVISTPLLHWLAVPLVFAAYVILSLVFKNNME